MATNKQNRGVPFSVTCSGSTGIFTIAGASNSVIYITDVSGSTDLTAGTMTIQTGSASGTTTLWQNYVNGTAGYHKSFINPLQSGVGESITISFNKTSTAYANASGFKITSQ